jgi:uncharacterized protein
MIRVEIDSIRVSLTSQQRVIVLRETEGERYLPIWIGPFEAEAITIELQGLPRERPWTHDLMKSILQELEVGVSHVLVNDLRDETFFARLVMESEGVEKEVDSRPSDAIALAVRLRVPIYVAEHVMDEVGILPESESDAAGPSEGEDEENLSVFRDFLNSLDIDESGKGK